MAIEFKIAITAFTVVVVALFWAKCLPEPRQNLQDLEYSICNGIAATIAILLVALWRLA